MDWNGDQLLNMFFTFIKLITYRDHTELLRNHYLGCGFWIYVI